MIREQTKRKIFNIIQIGKKDDAPSRAFDYVLVCVIIVNIVVMILETFSQFYAYENVFAGIEAVCIVFFCVEYILRIWTANLLFPEESRGGAILKFITSFDGIVDLLTILPFFFLSGFVVFRMLRVVRIFHLFRLNSNYDSFNVITSVIKEKRNQILSSLFILIILMVAASLCMYSAENEAQPEVFDNAFSGLWWAVSTILTVGYGDMYPVTIAGKVLAIIIAILGVCVVAIPTGIISAGFVEQYTRLQRESIIPRGTVALNADPGSGMVGLKLAELARGYGITPLVIIRDGSVIIPTDDVVIATGDTLVYYSETK